ncbi:MAG: hypothetical protein IKG82_15345 [Oscillospiraceae bacterium]|nr:hypothetical protein [Oscillospiraceae bacterium]
MKKRLGCFGTVVLCFVLFAAGTTGCTALRTEGEFQETVKITAQNVPEGTYYADLLVQLPKKDKLRVPDTGVRLDGTEITESSEIFCYDTDNYVSASLHYGYADSFSFPEKQEPEAVCTVLQLRGNTAENRFSKGKQFLRIPSFRIAYVSQDGKVLGVTGPAAANPCMTPIYGIPFVADGSSARYIYISGSKANPAGILLLAELFLFAVLALPLYAVISAIRKHRETKAMIAQIQKNAEQNNENAQSDD